VNVGIVVANANIVHVGGPKPAGGASAATAFYITLVVTKRFAIGACIAVEGGQESFIRA